MADTKKIVVCPACKKEMTKVYMQNSNINVDICINGCGGILFDNRELEKFDEKSESADQIFAVIKGKTFESVNDKEIRVCPICNTKMVKQGSGVEGVEIDVCNVCGAKFLDNGELEKIREQDKGNFDKQTDENAGELYSEHDYTPIGALGLFVKNHIPVSSGRKATENFIRRYLKNL